MLRLLVIASALMSVSVMAQQTLPPHPAARGKRPGLNGGPRGGHPACASLKEACVRAGYSMTEPYTSEKSVVAGCMAKYARGEAAKGVAIKPNDKSIEPCIKFMKVKMAQASRQVAPGTGTGTGRKGQPAFSGNATPPRPSTGVQPRAPIPAPSKTAPKPGAK
jgi:hypothetical protein